MARTTKCLKGFVHEWEDYDETATHLIKQCERCHGKLWKDRIGADNPRINHEPPERV